MIMAKITKAKLTAEVVSDFTDKVELEKSALDLVNKAAGTSMEDDDWEELTEDEQKKHLEMALEQKAKDEAEAKAKVEAEKKAEAKKKAEDEAKKKAEAEAEAKKKAERKAQEEVSIEDIEEMSRDEHLAFLETSEAKEAYSALANLNLNEMDDLSVRNVAIKVVKEMARGSEEERRSNSWTNRSLKDREKLYNYVENATSIADGNPMESQSYTLKIMGKVDDEGRPIVEKTQVESWSSQKIFLMGETHEGEIIRFEAPEALFKGYTEASKKRGAENLRLLTTPGNIVEVTLSQKLAGKTTWLLVQNKPFENSFEMKREGKTVYGAHVYHAQDGYVLGSDLDYFPGARLTISQGSERLFKLKQRMHEEQMMASIKKSSEVIGTANGLQQVQDGEYDMAIKARLINGAELREETKNHLAIMSLPPELREQALEFEREQKRLAARNEDKE